MAALTATKPNMPLQQQFITLAVNEHPMFASTIYTSMLKYINLHAPVPAVISKQASGWGTYTEENLMSNRSMHVAETWTLFSAVHIYMTSMDGSSSIIVFMLCSRSAQVCTCHACISLMILLPRAIWSSCKEMSRDTLVRSVYTPCWDCQWHIPECGGCG